MQKNDQQSAARGRSGLTASNKNYQQRPAASQLAAHNGKYQQGNDFHRSINSGSPIDSRHVNRITMPGINEGNGMNSTSHTPDPTQSAMMQNNGTELQKFLNRKRDSTGPALDHPVGRRLDDMKRNLHTLMFSSGFADQVVADYAMGNMRTI